ncbi:MAG: hypothetical protein IT363_13645 [Methanoregulaceae archaeon]|nr:hypothetical protein [Methanoregulaceae archaeon]
MRYAFLLALVPVFAYAQETTPPAEAPKLPPHTALIANLPPRNVGPTTMGGRIADIAVYEKNPSIFYVATAAGGVWKTENGGFTMTPVLTKTGSSGYGAIAVAPSDPNVVYVGMGEASSRNSVSWGDGIYKTTDGGKTWNHVGLKECRHFSKIVIDPRNHDVAYAAGMGDLFGYNPDRGVYKTTDGGKTWAKILYVDEKTGFIDLVINPKNPNELMTAAWEKLRKAYDWTSGGPGSALFKTTNGGKNWKKITKGIPSPGILGRIGLDYHKKNPKIMIATIEHRNVADNKREGGLFRSEDGGESWTRVNPQNPRPFYFSLPRIDPNNPNRVYVPGVQVLQSEDGGKTLTRFPISVHVDFHAFWINPADSNHIIVGEDGGMAVTRDRGATWQHLHTMPLGQFYAIAFDMRKPYWVYGGLQDNGSWASPTQTWNGGPTNFDAFTYAGGDGFHVQVDPEDWTTVYAESQGGALYRIDLKAGGTRSIRPNANNTFPRPAQGQGTGWRFNWSSPIHLSPHNSKTVFFGGNVLFRSVNRGDNWEVISPDLSTNNPDKLRPGVNSASPENTGAERHCTIITISESPIRRGVIWVGTDDGQVQVTQDDGRTWSNVTLSIPDLPANTWVSRVTASKYVVGRAYATFDGHRNNDYKTYVYLTEDYGKTWAPITTGLPENDPAYVIKEGLQNPNLLFLGTELGLYVSLDRGKSWARFENNFPTVPVHDLAIHPRDGDLVIGTHGRSIWTLPVSALEEMTSENMAKDAHLAKPSPIYQFGRVSGKNWDGDGVWQSPNTQPGTYFCYYLRADAKEAKIVVTNIEGQTVFERDATKTPGLNVMYWNARGRTPVRPGDYRVTLTVDGKEYISSVKVEDVTDTGQASPPR